MPEAIRTRPAPGAPGKPDTTILHRAESTLAIMHRWGYAPTLDALASSLLGGSVDPAHLASVLSPLGPVNARNGFVFLRGRDDLVERSMHRVESHRAMNGGGHKIAAEFADDLAAACPFVECIALTGSLASGGYRTGDDVDFDLVVRSGTKYTSYLLANLIGLRYAWRYRGRGAEEVLRTPLLPKVTCINVVWPDDETTPFARQDEGLAFELSRCLPLRGIPRFRALLDSNPWIGGYFPQLYRREWTEDGGREPTPVGRFLSAVARHPRALRLLEALSFGLSWILYRFVQGSRRGDAEAEARMDFLRRVKYPYEVFPS